MSYSNIIKAIYSNPRDNINLHEIKSENIFVKPERRKWYLFSVYVFNTENEVLTRTIREPKKIKRVQIGREEIKISFSGDDMIYASKKIKTQSIADKTFQ